MILSIIYADNRLQKSEARHIDIRTFYAHNFNLTAREILKLLRKDGWYVVTQNGSHIQMEHPTKKGKVTVPNHKDDHAKGTLHSIYTQAKLKQ